MSSIPAVIVWAGLTMVATIGAVTITALNIKEKISAATLASGVAAATMCGFTVSITAGLGVSAVALILVSLLMGYEG